MHAGESGVEVGNIDDVPQMRELVERPREEYEATRGRTQHAPTGVAAQQNQSPTQRHGEH